jgi:hypothetical protein
LTTAGDFISLRGYVGGRDFKRHGRPEERRR